MGVAVPRAPVVTRSPEPPQKFGHGPLFVGQLLSRNQVSQNNQGEPPLNRSKAIILYHLLKIKTNFDYPRDVSIDQDQSTLRGGETARQLNYRRCHR